MKKTGVSQKIIVFNDENKFLTMFRTETAPAWPNTWDLPGGDIDFGEDPLESIEREVKEETGLDIESIRPFDVNSRINDKGDFWVTVGYTARAASNDVVLSFEHNDYKWVSPEEFLKLKSREKLIRFVKKLEKI